MENLSLTAQVREITGKQVADFKNQGLLPAVLYGHKLTNKNLVVKAVEFDKVFQAAGESTLVDLQVNNDQPVKVLIHDVQHDYLSNQIVHVDFLQVKMDEKITASVHIKLLGEAPAVKELGGVLVTSLEHVEVKCLPGDLVKEIVVDLSVLKNFGDRVLVKDLPVSAKLEILASPEATVIGVSQPRAEEVAAAPAAETAEAPAAETAEAPAGEK